MQEIKDIDEISGYEERLTDKHWEECRQIALYQDERNKALALLEKVSEIHYVALHSGCNEVSAMTGELMHKVRALENEIARSEVKR